MIVCDIVKKKKINYRNQVENDKNGNGVRRNKETSESSGLH